MEPRFLYHANSLAIGGFFTRPVRQVVDVPAASVVPIDGGNVSTRVEGMRVGKLLAFQGAETYATGSPDRKNGAFTSLASATVEGLNVMDVVSADRVVAQLATKYVPGSDEPEIVPLGTRFENLQIAGRRCHIDLDVGQFTKLSTYSAVQRHYAESLDFRIHAQKWFSWYEGEKVDAEVPPFPESQGMAMCSLVRELEGLDGTIKRQGCRITIPYFGTVTLAEFLITKKSRRLTMLRFELGSPVEAMLSVGGVEGNGSTFP